MNSKRERFTYDYYREFVSRLSEDYSFTSFQEGKELVEGSSSPLAILRHDIDMDPESALRMSGIEFSLGVRATYFLQVRCPLYNVFSDRGIKIVNGILSNGHHLGLHFDCALYDDVSAENINSLVSAEISLLESFIHCQVVAVSFHRPGKLEMSGIQLESLPNTYEEVFLKKFEYFSDSRGEWARGDPLESEAFAEKRNLHILAHPVWWTELPMKPYDSLVSLVGKIGRQSEQYISENCQVWNQGGSSNEVT